MWKVYLFEFILVVILSVIWVYLIDKTKSEDYNNEPFP